MNIDGFWVGVLFTLSMEFLGLFLLAFYGGNEK